MIQHKTTPYNTKQDNTPSYIIQYDPIPNKAIYKTTRYNKHDTNHTKQDETTSSTIQYNTTYNEMQDKTLFKTMLFNTT